MMTEVGFREWSCPENVSFKDKRAAPWSAAARGRLGWAVSSNARTVAPKESGDTSPHFKMSDIPARLTIRRGDVLSRD